MSVCWEKQENFGSLSSSYRVKQKAEGETKKRQIEFSIQKNRRVLSAKRHAKPDNANPEPGNKTQIQHPKIRDHHAMSRKEFNALPFPTLPANPAQIPIAFPDAAASEPDVAVE